MPRTPARRIIAALVAALALTATASAPAAARCTALAVRYRLGGTDTTLYRNGCVADLPFAGATSGSRQVGTSTHYVGIDYTIPLP